MNGNALEVAESRAGDFGPAGRRLLRSINEEQITEAGKSIVSMLGASNLTGLRFLDAGSGGGLFSLAARRLGASVCSFDCDPRSVASTAELKRRYFPDDPDWKVLEGSLLDTDFLAKLGRFDVVYSWGVLHHTGSLWRAMENIVPLVSARGRLFISIYNDQGLVNGYWRLVKAAYARSPIYRWLLLLVHAPYVWGLRWLVRTMKGRQTLERGTPLWHYTLGLFEGYPFEVGRPEHVVEFYWSRNFLLEKVNLCGSHHGCNEFLFVRQPIAG